MNDYVFSLGQWLNRPPIFGEFKFRLYKTRIGGRSYSSTTDNSLDFYTNKTKQHLQTWTYCNYRHKPIAWKKLQALLTIQTKHKLTNIFQFYFSVAKALPKSSQACGKRRKTLKFWNAAISKYIQLAFSSVIEKLFIFYNIKFRVEYKCEVLVKEAAEHYLVSDIKRDIPKFDTVLLHSNWSKLRRKYFSKIPTDINALSCGPKA